MSATAFAAEPPLATTDAVTLVGANGATLNGKVNPKGSAVAACRFEYGTTTTYGAIIPCVPPSLGSGNLNVTVSADVASLEAGTTYHYRLIATSANGATQGLDRTFSTTGTPSCPNADRRFEQGVQVIQLPDCMALEQVSPPQKGSQRAVAPMISADGSRIALKSLAALADTPGNISSFYGDVYVAERHESGWGISPTSPPPSVTIGWDGGRNLARSFDPTLSCWTVFGSTNDESLYFRGIGQLSRGCLGGAFQPLSPMLTPMDGGVHGQQNVADANLQAASADQTHFLVATGESSATYLAGDPAITPGFDRNVYLSRAGQSSPSLALLSRDEVGPDAGKAWGGSCGVRVGGIGAGWRSQGAVSIDGSQIYFSTRAAQPSSGACTEASRLRIMKREETVAGADISELIQTECDRVAPACKTDAEVDGDDFFQGASVDGTRVYFTTNRQLADSDLDGTVAGCSGFFGTAGCDLYLYDATKPSGERLTQVSAGVASASHPVIGEGADVYSGTTAISGDGSHVYFVAGGVLTTDPNPSGATAADYLTTEPKLYAWDADSAVIRFVGAVSSSDAGQLWGGNGTFLNTAYPVPVAGENGAGEEVGGRGNVLVFQSAAALTSNDADGTRFDVFRYDADASPPTLECVSCRPGGPDGEPHDVSSRAAEFPAVTGTAYAEQERWVSEDGDAITIRTDESLFSGDVDGESDDYLWRQGELTLLPGTTPPPGLLALGERPSVLSHDGSQVAFTAYQPLLPSDIDTAPDVYVARVGGGFANPVPVPICLGESCRPSPVPQPQHGAVASETALSRGNVRPKPKPTKQPSRCPKGHRKVKRNGNERCVKRAKKKDAGMKQRANYNLGVQK